MSEVDYDKHFSDIAGLAKKGVIIALIINIVGAILSLGVVGTIIYLLWKNFG